MIPDPRPLFSRCLAASESRGEVYLANHSLGRPPDSVMENVARGLALWPDRLDGGWEEGGWLAEARKFRSLVASLLGLPHPDCVVPKCSAGQGLRAVLNAFSPDLAIKVVTTTGEFDSVDFILKAYQQAGRAEVTFVTPTARDGPVSVFEPDAVIDSIHGGTDLVVLSSVMFGTGQVMDGMAHVVHMAHACGALVLVDVYHALGVLPTHYADLNADFVVGGCYKYLRGGPGAGFLMVHPRMLDQDEFRTRDTGWFAKRDTFGYGRSPTPEYAEGGDAWLECTPPVLQAYQATPGLELVTNWGVEALREDSLAKQARLREVLSRAGQPVFEPRHPEMWGGFSLVGSEDAAATAAFYRSRGVVADARGEFVRLSPDILTSEEEIERVGALLA